MINEDAYIEATQRFTDFDADKIPTNKVTVINIQKLPFERKNVPIVVSSLNEVIAGY